MATDRGTETYDTLFATCMSDGRIRALLVIAAALAFVVFAVLLSSSEPQQATTARLVSSPELTYDPATAGEVLPAGYRQLLSRDQIRPIYNPEFTAPDQVDWPDDSLVIGLAIDDAAKAYPITPLNQREMVIDSLAGIPVLVTW